MLIVLFETNVLVCIRKILSYNLLTTKLWDANTHMTLFCRFVVSNVWNSEIHYHFSTPINQLDLSRETSGDDFRIFALVNSKRDWLCILTL